MFSLANITGSPGSTFAGLGLLINAISGVFVAVMDRGIPHSKWQWIRFILEVVLGFCAALAK
jgi:hypothetical protein